MDLENTSGEGYYITNGTAIPNKINARLYNSYAAV